MKKLILGISIVGLLATLTSCEDKTVTSKSGTIVKGYLEDIQGGELILLQALTANNIKTVDTLLTDVEGNFEIGPNVPKIGFYRIFINNNNFVNLILEPNDTLEFLANVADLEGTYEVKGSEETIKLKTFNDLMNNYVDKIDSMQNDIKRAQANQDYQLYQEIFIAQKDLQMKTGNDIRSFVQNNTSYLASLSAVQKLDPDGDFELFVKVRDDLAPKIGGTALHNDLAGRIKNWEAVRPGAKMMDITLNDPKGEAKTLFSQLGEVTLVDFWASWCRPCRAENPNIVKAYKKYKKKGFEVVGISLDKDGNQWKEAIKADGLKWAHLSDLKFWNSAAAKQYNVQSIPASFLVDKNGVILAKNLRGPALEMKLMEVLGSNE